MTVLQCQAAPHCSVYCCLILASAARCLTPHPPGYLRMMPGLLEGQEKMSKSDPNSAIFMEDSEAEVSTKIKKAFCPPQV